ncbi:MAG: hypothetical protein RLZZ502_1361 [Pseudomonadota bacterium]
MMMKFFAPCVLCVLCVPVFAHPGHTEDAHQHWEWLLAAALLAAAWWWCRRNKS